LIYAIYRAKRLALLLESVAVEQLALLLKALPSNDWHCCWRALPSTRTRIDERYNGTHGMCRASPASSHNVEHDDGLYLKDSRRKEGERRFESVWRREKKGCNAKNAPNIRTNAMDGP
jgi:hypothetical protein